MPTIESVPLRFEHRPTARGPYSTWFTPRDQRVAENGYLLRVSKRLFTEALSVLTVMLLVRGRLTRCHLVQPNLTLSELDPFIDSAEDVCADFVSGEPFCVMLTNLDTRQSVFVVQSTVNTESHVVNQMIRDISSRPLHIADDFRVGDQVSVCHIGKPHSGFVTEIHEDHLVCVIDGQSRPVGLPQVNCIIPNATR